MPYGTGEVFIIEEIRELISRGHEVLVIPRSPAKTITHADDLLPFTVRETLISRRVLQAAAKQTSYLRSASRRVLRGGIGVTAKNASVILKALWLAELVRKRQVEHIHCHWAGTTATMAMLASELTSVPWSLTAHRSDIIGNNLLREKCRSARFVRAISEDGLRMLLERGVPPDPKLRVLHVGVRIPEASYFPSASRVSWRVTEPPVVLCPADFLEVKGHKYLLEAWRILKLRSMPGELWLAGRGELSVELKEMLATSGFGSTVKVLGSIRNSVLLDFYRKGVVSAVVLASIDMGNGEHEGIPTALMEAMSFGVPVIATKTGGIPELVRSGEGCLVAHKDPTALADAIEKLTLDRRHAAQLAKAGRARVADAFNVAGVVRELEFWFSTTCARAEVSAQC